MTGCGQHDSYTRLRNVSFLWLRDVESMAMKTELLKTKFHDSPEVYQLSLTGKDGGFRNLQLWAPET